MRLPRVLTTLLLVCPAAASAQDSTTSPSPFNAAALSRALGPFSSVRLDQAQAPAGTPAEQEMEDRACPGCPKRSLGWPLFDTLWLNVMYNGINHVRGHETARVSWSSWKANMESGFEWDNNPWGVNQVGHPYQGSNYFTAGRANGLGFYESAAVAAFGSATWEFYFENNRASLNDLINTTVGGITLGEVFHRLAWVVRNPASEKRKSKELIAMAIDPLGGLTRMMSGDATRVVDKPPAMIPSSLRYQIAGGVMWHGASLNEVESRGLPFVDVALFYGNTREKRSTVPFESFDVGFSLGGGGDVSHTGIRGRMFGTPFGGHYQFNVLQTFDFLVNPAYDYGGQGVDLEVGMTRAIASRTSLWMAGGGGVTLLGAVNSLIPPVEGADDPGGAGSDGSRTYDYGPGFRWSGFIQMSQGSLPFLTVSYQGYHVSVVDGRRANHVLQRLSLDGRVSVGYSLAVGAAGEYFFRKAYFWPAGNRTDESPQLRAYVVWSR